jgi:hypothetical protein
MRRCVTQSGQPGLDARAKMEKGEAAVIPKPCTSAWTNRVMAAEAHGIGASTAAGAADAGAGSTIDVQCDLRAEGDLGATRFEKASLRGR